MAASGGRFRPIDDISERGKERERRGGVGEGVGVVSGPSGLWEEREEGRDRGDISSEGRETIGEDGADRWAPPVRGREGKHFEKGLLGRGGRFSAGPDRLFLSDSFFFLLSFYSFLFS
jgi:hypothetical protein